MFACASVCVPLRQFIRFIAKSFYWWVLYCVVVATATATAAALFFFSNIASIFIVGVNFWNIKIHRKFLNKWPWCFCIFEMYTISICSIAHCIFAQQLYDVIVLSLLILFVSFRFPLAFLSIRILYSLSVLHSYKE